MGSSGQGDWDELSSDLSAALRFVRNACAGIPANQMKAEGTRVHVRTRAFVDAWTAEARRADLALVWIQMVANMMTGNAESQEIIWPWVVNEAADVLLKSLDMGDPKLTSSVLILIHNATSGSETNTDRLASSKAGPELFVRLSTLAAAHADDDSSNIFDLCYLILQTLVEFGHAGSILKAHSTDVDESALLRITPAQFSCIKILEGMASSRSAVTTKLFGPDVLAIVAQWFRRAYDRTTDILVGLTATEDGDAEQRGHTDLEALAVLLRLFGKMLQAMAVDVKERWSADTDLVGTLIGASQSRDRRGVPSCVLHSITEGSGCREAAP
ncbi:hypothetical protein DFJ74DRAFT_327067 [Hyaloraphidium curvatum]|nr:hypothetical protein DFJ74DRAFT_327067 [Hyaloraphidium curvatum]